jgi:hypothetical protein
LYFIVVWNIIDKMKTNLPRAQSSYHQMGEGGALGAYSEVMVGVGGGDPAPRAKIRYEWVEHIMPKNMGIVRPDRV